MKKNKILFWVFTILFAGFMIFTAVPDVLLSAEAVTFMKQLGYPNYFTHFIGVAKILGAIALLIPGFPRIKEWAYAGLFFDLIGAVFSILHGFPLSWQTSFMLIPIILGVLSYVYYHKMLSSSTK